MLFLEINDSLIRYSIENIRRRAYRMIKGFHFRILKNING